MAGTNQQSLDVVLNVRAKVDEAMKGMKQIQNSLGQLKLPKGLENSFEKSFGNLDGLIKKFNDQLNKGIKTKGDVTGLERITNQIDTELDKISIDFKKLTGQEVHFKIDTTEIKNAREELKKAIEDRNKFAASQADVKISKSGKSANELLDQMSVVAGNSKTGNAVKAAKEALNAGDIKEYLKQLAYVERYYSLLKKGKEELFAGISPGNAFDLLKRAISDSSTEMGIFNKRVTEAEGKLNRVVSDASTNAATKVQELNNKFREEAQAVKDAENAQKQLANQSQSLNQNIGQLESHVAMYFSFAAILRKVTQVARKAFQTVKELDAAMVETAVVTNFDVGDLWGMLPTYTKNANELGSTIKDVYDAATLYYQQGLNQSQAMALANETLKMARIGGLEAAEATDMMTAALRGFNMQINEMSAQRINDVYSKLAAITASDTRELGSAMERTASIANSANMAFETTSAFLAQMIETTREAPENLGTAMKTIVARFQEMKQDPTKLIDADGEVLNANRVDAALKTIGVNLMDTNGQFRNLDEVFLEISSKWDGLTQAQQRYIATIAAGSRQQSRFIAMMQNYDRTMELVEAANNSNGASQEQFNKTLEGLDAKLNKLKNAWDQFAMGLANNKIIKLAVDGLTDLFTIVNKVFGYLDKIPDPFGGLTKSIVTLLAVVKGMSAAGTILTGGVRGLGGWARGEEKFAAATPFGSMKKGIGLQFEEARTARGNAAAERAAARDAQTYKATVVKNLKGFSFGEAVNQAKVANASATKSLINSIFPPKAINSAVREKVAQITTNFQNAFRQGIISEETAINQLRANLKALKIEATDTQLKALLNATEEGSKSFTTFGSRVSSAGGFLTQFGFILQQTNGPLSILGGAFTTIGIALTTLGTSLDTLILKTKIATAAAFMHAAGMNAAAISAKKEAIATGEAAASSVIKDTIKNAGGAAKAIGLVGKALFRLLGPIAAIGLAVGIAVAVYREVTKDARALKEAGQAAGAAADAYSSAAQATSELRDNLSQLEEAQAGFDGLVEGTAAFNEQLIKSNELVLQLLKKYPMLYDYLTTESNGRMIISDEGLEEVLEYQKNTTGRAAALNTVANGEYQAQKAAMEEQQLKKERDKVLKDDDLSSKKRAELSETYEKEIELLEKQQETYRQSSKATAATTILSEKELNNQKAITQLYSDQYNLRKSGIKLSKDEAYRKYADFYNYDYRGGKLYDLDNNEVSDVTKEDVMAAAKEITVLTSFETDADSLNDVINTANKYFKDNFNWDISEGIQRKDSVISDLLGKNIEISEDVVQNVLIDTSALRATVDQLLPEQIAQIMGVSLDTVESDLDGYRDKVVNLLQQSTRDIAKAQAKNYADLGIMIGKAYGTTDVKWIQNQLKGLNQKQRQSMLQAAQGLEGAAGEEPMKALVRGMENIYERNIPEEISQMQDLIDGINWDSATERLGLYNDLIESGNESLKAWGEELRDIGDSANLITDAFEEVYDSQDFIKAMEDVDKYTDSFGHFDASGIKDLSKEVGSLNKLLETGEVTTGGMAKVMNLLHDNADLTLLDINDDLIKLLNNLGEFDTMLGEAHNIIENFDPGLDTGEAGDFFVDSIEKYNEFYENGEWGNPQMRAYAELIVGAKNFNDALKDNNGDLEKTYKQFNEIINDFANGSYDAWERVANMSGGAADMFTQDSDGKFHIDLTGIDSVEDIVDNLMEAGGYSRETAQMMLEFFSNYSPDFQSQLDAIAFTNSFNKNGKGYLENKINESGEIVLLQSDLDKFALASGTDLEDEKERNHLLNAIAGAVGKTADKIQTINDTGEDIEVADIIEEYNDKFYGTEAEDDKWIQKYTDEQHQDSIDIQGAIDGLKDFNLSEEDAKEAVWQAFQESDQDYYYKGEKVDHEKVTSREEFDAIMEEVAEQSHWVTVGEAIAEGFLNFFGDGEGGLVSKALSKILESMGLSPEAIMNGSAETSSTYVEPIEESVGTQPTSKTKQDHVLGDLSEFGPLINSDEEIEEINKIDSAVKTAQNSWYGGPTQESRTLVKDSVEDVQTLNDAWKGVLTTLTSADDKLKESRKEVYGSKDEPIKIPATIDAEELETTLDKETGKLIAKGKKTPININAKATIDSSQVETEINKINKTAPKMVIDVNNDPAKAKAIAMTNYIQSLNPKMSIDGDATRIEVETGEIFNYIQTLTPLMALGIIDNATDPAVRIYRNINGKSLAWNLKVNAITPTISFSGSFQQGIGAGFKGLVGQIVSSVSYNGSIAPGLIDTISNPPSNLGGGGGSGGGGGGGGGGGSDNKKNSINNWSIEEVVRSNLEKKIENYQIKIDKLNKSFDNLLGKIGTRVSDIKDNVKSQVSYLESVKKSNKEIAKSYQKDLNKLATGTYNTYVSYTDSNGESQEKKVNLSNYIYKDGKGNYQIDKNKIAKAGPKALQEAIFKAADGALEPLVSGLQSAQKAAEEADEAIKELQKQVSETFYEWKNELTQVYSLTQQIANSTSLMDRFSSHLALESARLEAGFGTINNTALALAKATALNTKATKDSFKAHQELIQAREKELDLAFTTTDEREHLKVVGEKEGTNSEAYKKAKEDLDLAKLMQNYISDYKKMSDGTVNFKVDWEGFYKDNRENAFSAETASALKEKLDALSDTAVALNDEIKDTTDLLADAYKSMLEYKKTIADFEDVLLNQLEKNLKTQVDNAKKLNDSIKKSLKNLLDEVKSKLNERRQAEDNAKTEQDIAKKQQRLASLRANTSGGNQVEIAQLEKEIADAQKAYGRTLEDQLLSKLQQQGDIAAAQREKQINLAETQIELSKGTNRALVAQWIKNPEKFRDALWSIWSEANSYEEKGEVGKEILKDQFKVQIADLENAVFQTQYSTELNSIFGGVNNSLTSLVKSLEKGGSLYELLSDIRDLNTQERKKLTAKELKEQGYTAREAYEMGYKYKALKEANYSLKEIREAGYSAKYIKENDPTVTLKQLKDAGYTRGDVTKAGFTKAEINKIYGKLSPSKTTAPATLGKAAQEKSKPKEKTYSGSLPSKYSTLPSDVKKIQTFLKKLGYYKGEIDGSYGPLTKEATKAFQRAANSQLKLSLAIDGLFGPNTIKAAKKFKSTKFKTGGLADYTGPAWLDGTPNKPELVLNATDTKNFVQLKDILASVMRGGVLEPTTAAVSGNTNIEVNINVDHIANDYDVDKLAKRIKRDIVKDSSYRNVTSAKKIR